MCSRLEKDLGACKDESMPGSCAQNSLIDLPILVQRSPSVLLPAASSPSPLRVFLHRILFWSSRASEGRQSCFSGGVTMRVLT